MTQSPIPPRADVDVANCFCLDVRKAARQISRFYDDRLAPTGLRTTQFSLLAMLNHRGELSVNELAGLLAMDRTTAGKNLQPLERAGYVEVKPCPTDHRSRQARLTSVGVAALTAAYPLWADANAAFEKSNGKQKSAALRDSLRQLRIGD